MNFEIAKAIEASPLSATTRHVALTLVLAADPAGLTWVSNVTVAKRTGLHRSAVVRAIRLLEAQGLIYRNWGDKADRKKSMFTRLATLDHWLHIQSPELTPKQKKMQTDVELDVAQSDTKSGEIEIIGVVQNDSMCRLKRQVGVAQSDTINPLDQPKDKPNYVASELRGSSSNENSAPNFDAALQQLSFKNLFYRYNQTAAQCGWTQAVHLTAADERKFAELAEHFTLHEWTEALERAARSAFIAEKKRENWPTFDWFLNPDSLCKLVEGKYDEIWDQQKDERRPIHDQLPTIPHVLQPVALIEHSPAPTPAQEQQVTSQIDIPGDHSTAIVTANRVSIDVKRWSAARDPDRSRTMTQTEAEVRQVEAWREALAEAERKGAFDMADTYRAMLGLPALSPLQCAASAASINEMELAA